MDIGVNEKDGTIRRSVNRKVHRVVVFVHPVTDDAIFQSVGICKDGDLVVAVEVKPVFCEVGSGVKPGDVFYLLEADRVCLEFYCKGDEFTNYRVTSLVRVPLKDFQFVRDYGRRRVGPTPGLRLWCVM